MLPESRDDRFDHIRALIRAEMVEHSLPSVAVALAQGGAIVWEEAFGFADRLPYATPIESVYSFSAGCHPAGSVIGAAGHNAAARVVRDLEG